jgi:Niemann-Pick C2 protein
MAVVNAMYVTVFVVCYVVMTVLAVPWKDCGSVVGKPLAVTVTGCSDKGTCQLHKGVNATFGVDFTSKEDASGLKMLVYGHIAGVDVPFPIDNPDGCKDSNISCPIKNGQTYGYRNVIFVKTGYPSLTLVVKLKLVDQDSKVISCVDMPVQIVSSPLKLIQRGKSNSIRL